MKVHTAIGAEEGYDQRIRLGHDDIDGLPGMNFLSPGSGKTTVAGHVQRQWPVIHLVAGSLLQERG
jgi:hypothetical protein